MPKAHKEPAVKATVVEKKKSGARIKAAPIPTQPTATKSKTKKTTSVPVQASKKQKPPPPTSHVEDSDSSDGFPEDGMDVDNDDDDDDAIDPELQEFIQELQGGGSGDEDDNEGSNGEGDDNEEVVVVAKPTARKRKGTAAGFEITASTPAHLPGQKKTAAAATASRVEPRTPTTTGRTAADDVEAPFTPFENKTNPRDASKPLLSLQTPTTRNIIKQSQHAYRASIVTKSAFPDDSQRIADAARLFIQVAKTLDVPRRVLRFDGDQSYQDCVIKIIGRAGTQVRGETANAAREIVGPYYGLGASRGSIEKNKLYVEFLLTQGNFLYRVLEHKEADATTLVLVKRNGPYRNNILEQLIQQEYYHGHERMAVSENTKDLFNPMPLAAVAFAATAVQCALRDWSTGVRVKSSSDFTADDWSKVYEGHLRELERMKERKPLDVDVWMRRISKNAWGTTRQQLASNAADTSFMTAEEMDDFSDLVEDDDVSAAA